MATRAQNLDDTQSCLNRARDDEPIFVLRANDPLAAKTVRVWADLYMESKAATQTALTSRQVQKVTEALLCADAMEAWYGANASRAPR